jgi:hypothetical protein
LKESAKEMFNKNNKKQEILDMDFYEDEEN